MIQIYDINDNLIYEAPLTEGCERVQELMAADHIQLSFKAVHSFTIPAGAYIDWFGIYRLLEPYTPTQQSEAEYLYTPQFHAEHITWKKYPFFFYTDEKAEPDWSLTGNATLFLDCVTMALQKTFGQSWHYSVASDLPASAYVAFQNTDIFSGLNAIAEAFKTEWYADLTENRIYLGHVSRDEQAVLEVGKNVNVPSVTANSDAYFNRFYAFGSTRNIPQNYVGANTQNVVNKRLTLDPAKYPDGYKDIKDLKSGEDFATNLFFDNIYPRATEGTEGSKGLAISNVRERRLFKVERGTTNKVPTGETDENGNPIYEMYSIWYFNIASLEFSKSMIIEGTDLTCSFESGALQGREFVLGYHEEGQKLETADGTPFYVYAGDYEILYVEENGITIPTTGVGLIPADGDEVALFNLKLPDSYVEIAYKELEAALDEEIARRQKDYNSYTFKSNPVAFAKNNPNLYLGRAVKLINSGNALDTRITKLTYKLDSESPLFPNEMTITIGEKRIKGSVATLKEEVVNANRNIDLLAALNKQTTTIQEAYKRTQDAILQGFNRIANMWQLDDDGNVYSKFNVYTLGWLSTKGISANEDGGGTGIDIARMWEELASDDATKLINLSHMPSSVKTAVNWVSSVTSSDADSQINKWNEIVSFLSGISDTSSLSSILSGKANASAVEELSDDVSALSTHITNILARKVNAGTGLTGGGTLNADVTLSLATIGKAGTYTKVVVDAYGRVTGNSALLASDIPQLEMGQINGLANELEAYSQLIESSVQESEFAAFFAQEMAKWFVLDSENKGIKTANGYGFYSESYISSKGLSNETGTGGTGVALSAVWDSLANNTDAYGSTKIHLDHIPTLTASKISDFPTLVSAFANDAGYITASAIINKADKATTLAGYGITDAVTLNTEQTITRVKTFTNGIKTPIIVNQTSDNALFIGATDNYYCDLNTQLSPGYSAIIPLFQKIGSATSTTGDFGSARKGVIRLSGNASESQLLFDHYNATIHYRGSTSNGAFTEWKRIAFLDNVVTLSGNQTITGEKVFQTGDGSNVPLRIRNTADSAHIQAGSSGTNNTASLTISGLGRSMLNSLQVYATNTAFHGSISTTKISGITDSSMVANLHAQYSTNLMGDDNRNVNEAPHSYGTRAVNWRFKRAKAIGLATNDSEYAGVLHLTPWNDSTGGPDHQLAFESNGKIKYRSGLSTWSDWTELLTDANGVTLGTEQEITGTKTFTSQLKSNVATGKSPLVVNSTTMVANLNANYLGGLNKDSFQKAVYDYVNVVGTANDTAMANVLAPSNYDGTNYLGGSFKFYDTKFYNGRSNTSNRCQLAYGYDVDSIHFRRYKDGTWYDWKKFVFTEGEDNIQVTNASARFTANNGTLSGFFGFSGNVIGAYSTSLAEWLISASTSAICIAPQGKVNVGVKTWTPAYDFHVNGSIGANSLTIGQATISWDSVNGMLKVNTGAYFTGPVSTKGVSGGSGLVAVAQFGITWHDAWAIDVNSTYVESFGTTNKSISDGQGTTNGSTITIVSDAFEGKKIGDIEIFTLGWENEAPANVRLAPYKISGNTLYCSLLLSGTMSQATFKIKIY